MALGWRQSYFRYKEFFLNIVALYKKRSDLKAFLEIVLSISAIIIFLLFALKPTALTIISLLGQIKEKQTTLSNLTQKISNLRIASTTLSQMQNVIPDINIAVPTSPSPDVLSQQAEAVANKNSTEIVGISINQVTLIGTTTTKTGSGLKPLPEGAKEMPFTISVKGDFPNLLSFIKDFENLRIVNKIDTLSIGSSVTDKGIVIVAIISGRVPFTGN